MPRQKAGPPNLVMTRCGIPRHCGNFFVASCIQVPTPEPPNFLPLDPNVTWPRQPCLFREHSGSRASRKPRSPRNRDLQKPLWSTRQAAKMMLLLQLCNRPAQLHQHLTMNRRRRRPPCEVLNPPPHRLRLSILLNWPLALN
jgi:hypothetical protein